MPTKVTRKKIVYIIGLGRSGSTLADIVIGNGAQAFSCGEICRFPLRCGVKRNSQEESTDYQFWQTIRNDITCANPGYVDFARMSKLHHRYEYHTGFLRDMIFGLSKSTDLNHYHKYLYDFYSLLFERSEKTVLVDSSKYSGRAWHLSQALPADEFEICYLYLQRHPVDVVQSFAKQGIEQSSKNWGSANLLYFLANHLCQFTYKRLAQRHRAVSVSYEELVEKPHNWLEKVEKSLAVDLSRVHDRLNAGKELTVGNLFDGNRIRHLDKLVIQEPKAQKKYTTADHITLLINRRLYDFQE